MGRRKIEIARIENERHRMVTYAKRKAGLIKKATELAILCDATVGLIVFSGNRKMTVYSNTSIEDVMERWRTHAEIYARGARGRSASPLERGSSPDCMRRRVPRPRPRAPCACCVRACACVQIVTFSTLEWAHTLLLCRIGVLM